MKQAEKIIGRLIYSNIYVTAMSGIWVFHLLDSDGF